RRCPPSRRWLLGRAWLWSSRTAQVDVVLGAAQHRATAPLHDSDGRLATAVEHGVDPGALRRDAMPFGQMRDRVGMRRVEVGPVRAAPVRRDVPGGGVAGAGVLVVAAGAPV